MIQFQVHDLHSGIGLQVRSVKATVVATQEGEAVSPGDEITVWDDDGELFAASGDLLPNALGYAARIGERWMAQVLPVLE